MGIEITDNDLLPFYSQGSTIFFTSRYPNDEEMENYPHIIVTSDNPWDPHGLIMPGGLDEIGHPIDDRTIHQVNSDVSHNYNRHHQIYETDRVSVTIDGNTEQLIMERMINSVHVTSTRHLEMLQSKTRHSQFQPEHVAAIFNVGLGTVKDILAATMQEGI